MHVIKLDEEIILLVLTMPCLGQKGDRRSAVALAMRHTQ